MKQTRLKILSCKTVGFFPVGEAVSDASLLCILGKLESASMELGRWMSLHSWNTFFKN